MFRQLCDLDLHFVPCSDILHYAVKEKYLPLLRWIKDKFLITLNNYKEKPPAFFSEEVSVEFLDFCYDNFNRQLMSERCLVYITPEIYTWYKERNWKPKPFLYTTETWKIVLQESGDFDINHISPECFTEEIEELVLKKLDKNKKIKTDFLFHARWLYRHDLLDIECMSEDELDWCKYS